MVVDIMSCVRGCCRQLPLAAGHTRQLELRSHVLACSCGLAQKYHSCVASSCGCVTFYGRCVPYGVIPEAAGCRQPKVVHMVRIYTRVAWRPGMTVEATPKE